MVRLNDRRMLCLAAAVATLCVVSSASARVTGVPTAVARSVDAGRTIWVSLTDKGPEAYLRTLRVEDYVSTRALERMRRRGGNPDPVQSFPLYAPYLTQLEALGAEIVGESRWTNTVALRIRPDQLPAIAELPFVSGLRPTARLRQVEPVAEPIGVPLAKPAGTQQEGDVYSYGASRNQLALLQIPTVHALGLDGTGVRIGVLDTGFKIDNGVFDSLRLVPGGTWDFLNNDSDVDDGEGGSARHGTNVLSLLAGFVPGELIGAAPGAEYALAKSEDISQEVYEEEVHWVEALHWAVDSLGCDLVSSSLGYSNWYTDPAIFDGDSALSTVAADLA
ncbi:MAG TPA: S8 family serine peptidase, partial [candidate division Zixibacteria bacterium]|nr:S8 family serine peptidase [candidate division Zixibacteria bacterium]